MIHNFFKNIVHISHILTISGNSNTDTDLVALTSSNLHLTKTSSEE